MPRVWSSEYAESLGLCSTALSSSTSRWERKLVAAEQTPAPASLVVPVEDGGAADESSAAEGEQRTSVLR
jgi:hypothetical protein